MSEDSKASNADARITQEWRQIEPEPRALVIKHVWLLVLNVLLATILVIATPHWVPKAWIVPFFIGAGLASLFMWRQKPNDADPRQGDWKLAGDALNAHAVLVDIWVMADGAVSGRDRGVLWSEEGNLRFKGRRSWFRIRRQDVSSLEAAGLTLEIQLIDSALPPDMQVERRQVKVRLFGWQKSARQSWRRWVGGLFVWPTNRARPLLTTFMDSQAASQSFSQLPPLGFDPRLKATLGTITDNYSAPFDLIRFMVWFDAFIVVLQGGASPMGTYLIADLCVAFSNILMLVSALAFGYVIYRSSRTQGTAV